MASALGTLALNLVARTDKFEKGMKGTSKRMTAMQKSIGLLKQAAIGLGAAFSVRMFAGAIQGSLDMMDSIGKLSDRVGIATETLAGLRHAAALSGMDTEAFNSALEKLAKNIGDVNMKSGEARYAIEKLGLNAEEIANMGLDNALLLIADRFNRLGNETEQAAVITSLFGRSGYDLINFLKLGSDGISDLIKENEELGGSFTREQAAMAEAANDAVLRMKTSWKSFSKTLAIEVAPKITKFSDEVVENFDKISKAIEIAVMAGKTFYLGFGHGGLDAGVTPVGEPFVFDESGNMIKGKQAIDDYFAKINNLADATETAAVESSKATKEVNNLSESLNQSLVNALRQVRDKVDEMVKTDMDTYQDFQFAQMEPLEIELYRLKKEYLRYADVIDKLFKNDDYFDEMDNLEEWFKREKLDILNRQNFEPFSNLKTNKPAGSLLEVGKYIDAAGLINKVDYGKQMVALQKETNKILRDQERFSVR